MIGVSDDIQYSRFIDFSEEEQNLIRQIWPDGDNPKPYVLRGGAANKNISVAEYLRGRLSNPNYENGRMPERFRKDLAERNKIKTKGRKHTEETKAKMRAKHLGKKISKEQRAIMREANIGKKMSPEAIAKTVAANLGRKRTPQARANLKASAALRSGENSPTWKGGKWLYSVRKDRDGTPYKEWRTAVFVRDDYTCMKTGVKGGTLHAHHMWSYSTNDDLRFSVFNGVTLSDKAHRDFHRKYGTKNNTVWQFEEWLGRELPPPMRHEILMQEGWDAYELQQAMSDWEDD